MVEYDIYDGILCGRGWGPLIFGSFGSFPCAKQIYSFSPPSRHQSNLKAATKMELMNIAFGGPSKSIWTFDSLMNECIKTKRHFYSLGQNMHTHYTGLSAWYEKPHWIDPCLWISKQINKKRWFNFLPIWNPSLFAVHYFTRGCTNFISALMPLHFRQPHPQFQAWFLAGQMWSRLSGFVLQIYANVDL